MSEGYLLSAKSAARVRDWLAATDTAVEAPGGFPYSRQFGYVRCTGAVSGGYYPGIVVSWHAGLEEWIEFPAVIKIKSGSVLASGTEYPALRSGAIDDVPLYLALVAPAAFSANYDSSSGSVGAIDGGTNASAWLDLTSFTLNAGKYHLTSEHYFEVGVTTADAMNSVEVQVQLWNSTASSQVTYRRLGGAAAAGVAVQSGSLSTILTVASTASYHVRGRMVLSGTPTGPSLSFVGTNGSVAVHGV